MSTRRSAAAAAIAGGTILALSLSPVSAFTLCGPSLEQLLASAQIEKVWWDRWGRWHGNYYSYYNYYGPRPYSGYRPYDPDWGYRDCWRDYYGRRHCGY